MYTQIFLSHPKLKLDGSLLRDWSFEAELWVMEMHVSFSLSAWIFCPEPESSHLWEFGCHSLLLILVGSLLSETSRMLEIFVQVSSVTNYIFTSSFYYFLKFPNYAVTWHTCSTMKEGIQDTLFTHVMPWHAADFKLKECEKRVVQGGFSDLLLGWMRSPSARSGQSAARVKKRRDLQRWRDTDRTLNDRPWQTS